jgi:hypothetical protein
VIVLLLVARQGPATAEEMVAPHSIMTAIEFGTNTVFATIKATAPWMAFSFQFGVAFECLFDIFIFLFKTKLK